MYFSSPFSQTRSEARGDGLPEDTGTQMRGIHSGLFSLKTSSLPISP